MTPCLNRFADNPLRLALRPLNGLALAFLAEISDRVPRGFNKFDFDFVGLKGHESVVNDSVSVTRLERN